MFKKMIPQLFTLMSPNNLSGTENMMESKIDYFLAYNKDREYKYGKC